MTLGITDWFIDEEGYAQLIDSDLHYECYRYQCLESYDAQICWTIREFG